MLEELLQDIFGFESFRPGQEEVITNVLDSTYTLGVLPTSRGKSLCYQLPSYIFPGATLVVSPLISLMEDQVVQLRKLGEKRVVAINSQLGPRDKSWVLKHISTYKFIFISPETLNQESVLKALKGIDISLFVVDEAHCISQWGIDFRPEYERLSAVITELSADHVLALTATADERTTADIIEKLYPTNDPVKVYRDSVDRENIAYQVVETTDKMDFLTTFIGQGNGPGIIYFSSREQCESVALDLNAKNDCRVGFYHGGMSSEDRHLIQQQFLSGELSLLCATSAFGMGIDKPDIRFVIHYHLPSSIEAYVQEAGRGGRDGEQTLSIILYQVGDEFIYQFHKKELEEGIAFVESLETFVPAADNLELHNKWISDLQEEVYNQSYLLASLEEKLKLKNEAISQMVAYIQTKDCRREFILKQFNERKKNTPEWCCDNCGMYDKLLTMSDFLYKETIEPVISWKEKLKILFNL